MTYKEWIDIAEYNDFKVKDKHDRIIATLGSGLFGMARIVIYKDAKQDYIVRSDIPLKIIHNTFKALIALIDTPLDKRG